MNRKVEFEFSAGGVVTDEDKVLVIKTKNLKGKEVWTFPKGHIEKRENAETSALREVKEETGYSCEILNQLDVVQYWFKDGDRLVKKTVKWFLMKPIKVACESGNIREPNFEVTEIKWLKLDDAKKILSYKSDRKLVDKLSNLDSKH